MRVDCQRGSRTTEERCNKIDPNEAQVDHSHDGDADRLRWVEKSAEAEGDDSFGL